MKNYKNIYWQILLVKLFFLFLILTGTTSCFTGIESTKKITLSREEKKLTLPTPEEEYMMSLTSTPLKEWPTGKRFIVSDDKAILVIVPQRGIYPTPPDSLKGKVMEFLGIESKINAAGNINVGLSFTDGAYTYDYDTGKDFEYAMEHFQSDQIPMLIDEDMILMARNLLVGQKFWIRSPLWYDKEGNRIDGKKFVEVTVTGVEPGNLVFPLQLQITTKDNNVAYVFMNFGNADNESRSFHNIFSLTDIKKHYPAIENDVWELICNGKVKAGMTKEEVKLSVGNPSDTSSGHDYSQTYDIWSFDNGMVLWFEDGRLVRTRQ
ncbi:MAG: hypothetical protein J1F38_04845 [Muribaculaceae bacterium]|nr:hypothetical protein [Muribaculaceae bacterium]